MRNAKTLAGVYTDSLVKIKIEEKDSNISLKI